MDCLYRAAPNPLPYVGAESVLVEQVLTPYDIFVAQIHKPQVGVEAGRDVSLAFHPESTCDVRRCRRGYGLQVVILSQQQLSGRLAA